MEEKLRLLGLSRNEISIYLSILKYGRSTGSDIRKRRHITNSRVYAAIDNLIQKGLITYSKFPKGKVYSALDPSVLGDIAKERQDKIKECIPFLKELQRKGGVVTETAVFEGFHGFKKALLVMANGCPKNETVYIIGFSNQAYENEKLATLLRDVNKISKRKKVSANRIQNRKLIQS